MRSVRVRARQVPREPMDLLLLLWLGRIAVHHVGVHEFRWPGRLAVSPSRSLERSGRGL
jgi:hypothetical protein